MGVRWISLTAPVDAAGGVIDFQFSIFIYRTLCIYLPAVVPHPAQGDPQPGQQFIHRRAWSGSHPPQRQRRGLCRCPRCGRR